VFESAASNHAPWLTDPLYGGMSPESARKSWEASQRRKAETNGHAFDDPIELEELPEPVQQANGHADEPPPGDDWQPPTEIPVDLSDAHGEIGNQTVAIEAKRYVFRDPATLPRRDRLYGSHLFRGVCSATIGAGGVGKSVLGITETLSMASHRSLLGARLASRPLRVWYWNLEDPTEELDRKVQAACLQHGLTADDLGGRLFINGREDGLVIAKAAPSGAIVLEPVIDALVAEIIAKQIDVVLIDPFVSCHTVSENDNGQIDVVVKKGWGRVAGAGSCAVDLVHHARKLGDNDVTAESARGASAMVAACRNVRVLNRMSKDEAARAGVENHRLYFRAYSDKANLAPPADKSEWYRLVGVDLRNGPPGESDNVQAIARWEWPDAMDGVTARDLFTVQKAVADTEWRQDVRAPQWVGRAIADVLKIDADSAPVQTRLKSLLKTWIETGALKVVRRKKQRAQRLQFHRGRTMGYTALIATERTFDKLAQRNRRNLRKPDRFCASALVARVPYRKADCRTGARHVPHTRRQRSTGVALAERALVLVVA
jgi:hypothetical protein